MKKDSEVLPLSPQAGTQRLIDKINRDSSMESPMTSGAPSPTKMHKDWEKMKKAQRDSLRRPQGK